MHKRVWLRLMVLFLFIFSTFGIFVSKGVAETSTKPYTVFTAGEYKEGLASFTLSNGKTYRAGFFDANGNIAIQPNFFLVDEFSEGLAVASVFDEDCKYGFIDKNGQVVIPFTYQLASGFSEGLASVEMADRRGYINKKGETVIPIIYEEAFPFNNGLAVAKLNGKWGYINATGKTVIPFQYDNASAFSEGFAQVRMNKALYFINTKGKTVVGPLKVYSADAFHEGKVRVVVRPGKIGYVGTNGKWVLPPIYQEGTDFSHGLAGVKLNGKFGYIDAGGKFAVKAQFDDGWDYKDGLARVSMNGKWGYINMNGLPVTPMKYDYFLPGFSEGKAIVKENGKYCIINSRGDYILSPAGMESMIANLRIEEKRTQLISLTKRVGT